MPSDSRLSFQRSGASPMLGALGAFNGDDSAGTWTLTVNDDFNQDGGSLNGWSLQVCSVP